MKQHAGMFKPGQSGNPKGRPKGGRALTDLLKKQGNKTMLDFDGKKRARKFIVPRLAWELATEGCVTLPSGQEVIAEDFDDLLKVWKFIYSQIDGPPKSEHDINIEGNIKGYIGISPDDWDEDNE